MKVLVTGGDIYPSYFDCRKADEQLGWKAKVNLEEGFRRTVDYFKASMKQ